MIKKLLKNKLFIILIIIVIILIIIKIFSKSSPKSDTKNQTSPASNSSLNQNSDNFISTPTSSPNPTFYPQEDEIIDLNRQIPLARLLPYQGKYFSALRYFKANNLEIIVFDKLKTDLAKKEAQEWLVQNGVDALDSFTVVYK